VLPAPVRGDHSDLNRPLGGGRQGAGVPISPF
jgi:hypothetical protein